MEMNLKYHINKYEYMKFLIILTLAFSVSAECHLSENHSAPISKEASPNTPKILRITYDATWEPKDSFHLKNSGSLDGNGNTYTLQYENNLMGIKMLKISSTNQENRNYFKYQLSPTDPDLSVFYFPWQKTRISLVAKKTRLDAKLFQCRWEGVYKGFLIIVESEIDNSREIETSDLAEDFHKYVVSSLTIY